MERRHPRQSWGRHLARRIQVYSPTHQTKAHQMWVHCRMPRRRVHCRMPQMQVHCRMSQMQVHCRMLQMQVHCRMPQTRVHRRMPRTWVHCRMYQNQERFQRRLRKREPLPHQRTECLNLPRIQWREMQGREHWHSKKEPPHH